MSLFDDSIAGTVAGKFCEVFGAGGREDYAIKDQECISRSHRRLGFSTELLLLEELQSCDSNMLSCFFP